MKDRLFFFAAYEGQRTADQVQTTRIIPTPSLAAGQLKYLCDPYDTSTSPPTGDPNCVAGNVVGQPNANGVTLTRRLEFSGIQCRDPDRLPDYRSRSGLLGGRRTCPDGGRSQSLTSSALFAGYPAPNSTSGGGDGLNSAAYTFPGNDPIKLNTYIFKLDYKITANGNHSLFLRGNLQNDHEADPPQFPGLPPNDFITNNSKGIAGGYTWIAFATI